MSSMMLLRTVLNSSVRLVDVLVGVFMGTAYIILIVAVGSRL